MNKSEKMILAKYVSELINNQNSDYFSQSIGMDMLNSFPSINGFYESNKIYDQAQILSREVCCYFHRLADSSICKKEYMYIVTEVLGGFEGIEDVCYTYVDDFGLPDFSGGMASLSESKIKDLILTEEWKDICESVFDGDALDMVLGKWKGNEYKENP